MHLKTIQDSEVDTKMMSVYIRQNWKLFQEKNTTHIMPNEI